jgi:cysteine desulfurase
MKQPIYLDYLSTTPIDPRVKQKMIEAFDAFGNSASTSMHCYGAKAMHLIEDAREIVAQLIKAKKTDIIFTSGATESNNLALKGAAQFYKRQGKHIITMKTEHKAVLDPCQHLESQGFEVTYLAPNKQGRLDLYAFEAAIRPDTILASIMHVNNETGVIQDIDAIARLTQKHHILFHVDAAQAAARLRIDISTCPIDLLSFSGHKMYGPKGIGALYIRKPKVRLVPLMHGGGHEQGYRSGTLPTHQIVGLGEACRILIHDLKTEQIKMEKLHQVFWNELKDIQSIHVNGDKTFKVPGCFNLTIDGIDAETLLLSLNDLAFSTGAACSTFNISPSHVLLAQGLTPAQIQSTIRLSLGRYTSIEEAQYAALEIKNNIKKLYKK